MVKLHIPFSNNIVTIQITCIKYHKYQQLNMVVRVGKVSKISYVVLKLETIHILATNTNQSNVYIMKANKANNFTHCIRV